MGPIMRATAILDAWDWERPAFRSAKPSLKRTSEKTFASERPLLLQLTVLGHWLMSALSCPANAVTSVASLGRRWQHFQWWRSSRER